MAKSTAMFVAALALVVVMATTSTGGGRAAAACDPKPLVVCDPAFMDGAKPAAACCSTLRAQEACLCVYAKDPKFAKYINNPNTAKTFTSCGIAIPKC
ncbi:Non-specific lipid-transfer protein 2 [Zea mays]|jgi:hypothetical protein|uniref:Nonspecific lipid-transfer protein n=2 Tax=Zea mays TaxID=4577 RepID=B6SGF4_MAIZE|nr:Non-specific lipid-transfer protein 2-like precursor [Zea mays]ACG23937.1 nonspecific lipid-transfer protein precursor [Zea mays]AQK58016.1 Nonspecific lipid-transfer protein [Zea mays]PWZ29348.1 Non-specific lipid-transfer protein 2 [Zea mays]|eukprot:NP_001146849.1 uncharacterized protein LOC100280457 precursor [Zea mays]